LICAFSAHTDLNRNEMIMLLLIIHAG